jgi:hypothetical protein
LYQATDFEGSFFEYALHVCEVRDIAGEEIDFTAFCVDIGQDGLRLLIRVATSAEDDKLFGSQSGKIDC